jgi:hypothetical protein
MANLFFRRHARRTHPALAHVGFLSNASNSRGFVIKSGWAFSSARNGLVELAVVCKRGLEKFFLDNIQMYIYP